MPRLALDPDPALLVCSASDDTAVRRAHQQGALVRLTAGRYLRREHWDAFGAPARHAMTAIAAVSCLQTPVVVSHASAAAFWGLPRLGPWPERVHVIDPRVSRSTALASVHKHAGQVLDDEVVEHWGTRVSSPVRTAVDIALASPARQAVLALDHGLRVGLVTRQDLVSALESRPTARGHVRALHAITFADERADSPGESLSRVVLHEAGIPVDELQRRFHNPSGPDAVVDFFWKDAGVVGEFDGETKYRDSRRWSGLSPEEVVIREKDRENWLRRQPEVRAVVRWTWRDLMTPGCLARLLRESGVVPAVGPSARSGSLREEW